MDKVRKARRKAFKGRSTITITDPLNEELVEDIVEVAPEVQMLHIDILEDSAFDLSLFSDLVDLLSVEIREGPNLRKISLEGTQDLELLMKIEINVEPEKSIEEIDLTPLANHLELKVVTIAGPFQKLKGIEGLKSIPNLESIGLYSLDVSELDLSPLSSCRKLESIYLGDLGPERPTTSYKLKMPKQVPLKIFEVSECYSEELELEIDFSFTKGIKSLDSFRLVNCNLTSFDFKPFSSLKRLGSIDLSQNRITHLNLTPILEIPLFTEKALGESPFVIDPDVVIQIDKKKEDAIPKILSKPDRIVDEHDGSYAIEYEFGHQWLKELLDTHSVEWI